MLTTPGRFFLLTVKGPGSRSDLLFCMFLYCDRASPHCCVLALFCLLSIIVITSLEKKKRAGLFHVLLLFLFILEEGCNFYCINPWEIFPLFSFVQLNPAFYKTLWNYSLEAQLIYLETLKTQRFTSTVSFTGLTNVVPYSIFYIVT